jgi:hypothetical protein
MPPGPAQDAALRGLADRFRLAMLTVGLSLAGLAAIVALRVQATG